MAEFKEVMRQRARLCESIDCDDCILSIMKTHVPKECHRFTIENYKEAEKIIMDWAAAHPEPQYPTWIEWLKDKFPNGSHTIHPCIFLSPDDCDCSGISCDDCRNTVIPADIAEKLGIKPEEV